MLIYSCITVITNNQNTITETNDIVKDKTYNKPIIKKGKWTEEEDS